MFWLKRVAQTAFVRPGLGYACVVWDPHTFQDKDNMVETQRRAASGLHLATAEKTVPPNSSLNSIWNP